MLRYKLTANIYHSHPFNFIIDLISGCFTKIQLINFQFDNIKFANMSTGIATLSGVTMGEGQRAIVPPHTHTQDLDGHLSENWDFPLEIQITGCDLSR